MEYKLWLYASEYRRGRFWLAIYLSIYPVKNVSTDYSYITCNDEVSAIRISLVSNSRVVCLVLSCDRAAKPTVVWLGRCGLLGAGVERAVIG